MNEGAAPGDIVSDDAFKMRAHRMGGTIYPERTVTDREAVINNSAPTNQPKPKEQTKKIKPELPDSRVSAEFQMAYNK